MGRLVETNLPAAGRRMVVFVPQGAAAISVQLTPRASSVLTNAGRLSHISYSTTPSMACSA
jgi:hypothetical protein